MFSPELSAQVEVWKDKIRSKTLTRDDMREIVQQMRAARGAVEQPKAGSRVTKARKEAAAKPDADALLAQLGL